MSQTLIKNINIVSMDNNRSVFIDGAILIENNKILEIGKYNKIKPLLKNEVIWQFIYLTK